MKEGRRVESTICIGERRCWGHEVHEREKELRLVTEWEGKVDEDNECVGE